MAKSSNQKLRIIRVMDYLRTQTDEDHPVSVNDILEYLESVGLPTERKTIYDDIELLKTYGEDIVLRKGRNGGYFCASHEFELREIKLLVDSVQSSKFIPEKQSMKLIAKLERLTNIYDAGKLQRQVYVTGRVKTLRESVFINVDYISAAINDNRAITFKYFNYNMHKQPEYRHGGKRYNVSPFALIWDDENYYLLGFDNEAQRMKHFRVDKMDNIFITQSERQGIELFKKTDMSQYNVKVFSMYSGAEETVKLRFINSLVGVVIDRFGKDLSVVPLDDENFTISIKAQISPQFFAWVSGFGKDCEILSPETVRDQYEKHLKDTLKIYRKKNTGK